MNSTLLFRFME